MIQKDGNVSEASAHYETCYEAEDIANSMTCGVFDTDEIEFKFIGLEQD